MKPFQVFFKKSLIFLQYFLSTSTIHGLNHMSNKKHHYLEILVWSLLVIFSTYWVANLSGLAVMRYVDNPTVISMERDYFTWNTSFPTATICPSNKTSEVLLERYAGNNTALMTFLKNLAEANYDTFDKVIDYGGFKPDDYMKVLLGLQIDFKPMITCPEGVRCELERSITEMGICYSFNSQLAVYNSPEYRQSGSWKLMEEKDTLMVNPLDGDIFINVVNIPGGYDVIVYLKK